MAATSWLCIAAVVIILQFFALFFVVRMHANDSSSKAGGSIEDADLGDYKKPKTKQYNIDMDSKRVKKGDRSIHPGKSGGDAYKYVPSVLSSTASRTLLDRIFGKLPATDFADLKYRSAEEIRSKFPVLFEELPEKEGFESTLKNPCWTSVLNGHDGGRIECLPYAYVLGFPKCGSSDLFERMKMHPEIRMPRRKEVRWFTRGEFTTSKMTREGGLFNSNDTAKEFKSLDIEMGSREEVLLGPGSSIFTFTAHFSELSKEVRSNPKLVTIDGGPHTIWWPTQLPDGSFNPEDIPPSQLVREIQPTAKFIITVADPVKRMYSDYYFLNDDLRPVRKGEASNKSPEQFHQRAVAAVNKFENCIKEMSYSHFNTQEPDKEVWFRASQICAHDRHKFSVGGHGRLGIGLYVLFIEKWLEHFDFSQFKIVRLEDYDGDSMNYMKGLFEFLEISEPSHENWKKIVGLGHRNVHRVERDEMLPQTEALLKAFYKPYNELLAKLFDNDGFLWEDSKESASGRANAIEDNISGNNNNRINSNNNNPHEMKPAELIPFEERPERYHNHGHDVDAHDHYVHTPHPNIENRIDKRVALRGLKDFNPRKMDISGLPMPDGDRRLIAQWLRDDAHIQLGVNPPKNNNEAAHLLCVATFALDLAGLKYLLYDLGIDAKNPSKDDHERNAYHCLSMLYSMGESGAKSQVFAELKGVNTWLSSYLNPPLPEKMNTVPARMIIDGLEDAMSSVLAWLDRAEVSATMLDKSGNSPLHIAALAGEYIIVEHLLKKNADPNEYNLEIRTPMHFAAVQGHAKVLAILTKYGGNLNLKDSFGNSAMDIVSNPGPVSKDDALKYLNITQRDPRKIERILNPELNPQEKAGWKHGSGSWGTERLAGYETDLSCDVDQYWADEIDGKTIFDSYISRNAPVLIRGLIDDWGVADDYKKENLIRNFGNITVEISDIPYQKKFGGVGHMDMKLADYIDAESKHSIVGGDYPWYIFRGHPIPAMSESATSLVSYARCKTPRAIQEAFNNHKSKSYLNNMNSMDDPSDASSREIYINAQWALGGVGTGAPVHYHNTAWNALVYGAKKWYIFPPHVALMSNKQIKNFVENDLAGIEKQGYRSVSCVQLAGDVMIIPENWGHGVLNIQDSVAIASEAKYSLWRLKPSITFSQSIPFDNRSRKANRNNRNSRK